MNGKTFLRLARKTFEPLLAPKGFRYRRGEQSAGVTTASFIGPLRAIEIGFDRRDGLVEVYVFKVRNGEIVREPLVIGESSVLTSFNVDDFFALREHVDASIGGVQDRDSETEVRRILRDYAKRLSECPELIEGEFRVPPGVEKRIKGRLARADRGPRSKEP